MKIPKLAIDNSSFTWMLIIFLTILGVRAYMNMPRTENPEVTVPGTSILCIMPGASSLDMETLIALPMEEALHELEDIKEINVAIRDGIAIISVEFEFHTDADEKYDEMVRQVNSIRSSLPEELSQIDIWQWSIANMNMMQLALVSPEASFEDLEKWAEDLKKRVEKIPHIRKVQFYGLPEQEIHILLDFEKMAMLNTSMEQLIQAIVSSNANIPGGELKLGNTSLSVKSSGSFQNLEEIRNCVVNSYQGRLIYLRDLATVKFAHSELSHITRFGAKRLSGWKQGGIRSIFIGISQKEGLNVLQSSEELAPLISSFREELPEGIGLEVIYSQSDLVDKRISGFIKNLLQGMVLVVLVILLSLGLRSAVVVALAIPLSLTIGLGFVDLSGFGLQQISIAGLVVVLGMLVDNSIVMVENINRYIRMGHPKKEASIQAASEIAWPVISATITTILAFVPIAAMPEMVGEFIKSLPVTIMITLSVSLLIALSFTPMVTSRFLRDGAQAPARPRGLGQFLHWVARVPFRRTLSLALKRPLLTITLALLYLLLSSWMFTRVGISFFPKAQQPNLMIQASLPEGSSLDRTDALARSLESVLDTMPQVRYYATNVGHGNAQIYYNVFPRRYDMRFAEIFVELYDLGQESFDHSLAVLRKTFEDYPGVQIRVKDFEQGPPFESPVQIFVTGEDLEVLKLISSDVEDMIRSQEGAINIENQFVKTNTELLFEINREKANMLGVPVIEIDRTIRSAVTGIVVSRFRDSSGEAFDMVMKMDHGEKFDLQELDKVYVSSLSGRQIPIRQFVETSLQQVPSSISRFNRERTAEIRADVAPDHSLDEVMDPVLEELTQYRMPEGYTYHIRGELKGRADSFGGMTNAVLIAIISIFAVLVLQFRSLRQPLLVFIAVPFAFTGMIWALLLTGYSFSFTAFVGLTSLVGIVVNNSIILLDYINVLRKRGESLETALLQAAETRLTPIALTALTTIGGLLPLTLMGGNLWAPMGWTIIGGLLVSTLLTLVIVPVSYLLFERRRAA